MNKTRISLGKIDKIKILNDLEGKLEIMIKMNYTVKYGLLIFAGMAGLFLLMKSLNLEKQTELRFFNIFIIAYFSSRLGKKLTEEKQKSHFVNRLFQVFAANILAVILSIAAIVFFVKVVDPSFEENFQFWILFSGDSSLTRIAGALFIEGSACAAIVSLVVMQYFQFYNPSIKSKSKQASRISKTRKVKRIV